MTELVVPSAIPEIRKPHGFMAGSGHNEVFTKSKRKHFLTLLETEFPNFTKCCDLVGISRWTYDNHFNSNADFRMRVRAIQDRHVDEVHQVRFQEAKTPRGAFDRDRLLYGHLPEIYNPAHVIEVRNDLTPDQAKARLSTLSSVVDAEVVGTVRKIRNEAHKQAQRQLKSPPPKPKG